MAKNLSKEQKQFCAKAATKLVSDFMKNIQTVFHA